MAIKIIIIIIIIVIKITITVIMKIKIVNLMKIVVQSHNPKTYICSNSDNAQQEV